MTVLTLQPDATSGVDTSLQKVVPTTNFGTDTGFVIGNSYALSVDTIQRALLRFDLSTIPANAVIIDATLTLTVLSASFTTTPQTYYAKRCTRTWGETTATWNNYNTDLPWTAAGGDTDATGQDTMAVSSAVNLVFPLLKTLCDDAILSQSSILNLLVRGPETLGVANYGTWYSSDYSVAASRPKLVINYTVSTYYQVLAAVKTKIEALSLPVDSSTRAPGVVIRKVAVDRNTAGTVSVTGKQRLPLIILAPWRETMDPRAGVNSADDVVYGVLCLILAADNQEGTLAADLSKHLYWREQIANAFRLQPQVMRTLGVTTIIDASVEPMDASIREAWADGYFASALLLKFTSREARG